jgi:hypothetical protein
MRLPPQGARRLFKAPLRPGGYERLAFFSPGGYKAFGIVRGEKKLEVLGTPSPKKA